jgi:hypothetical protein
MFKDTVKPRFYDLLGIGSSVVCLIHCALLPLIVVGNAFLHKIIDVEGLEYLFLVLSFFAVMLTAKNTNIRTIRFLLWIVFSMFSLSIIFSDYYGPLEYVSWFCSAALAVLHIANMRYSIR